MWPRSSKSDAMCAMWPRATLAHDDWTARVPTDGGMSHHDEPEERETDGRGPHLKRGVENGLLEA